MSFDHNIALLLDKNSEESVIDLSERFSKEFNSTLKLDRRGVLPHLSLYLTSFSQEAVSFIRQNLLILTEKDGAVRTASCDVKPNNRGLIMLGVQKTKKLCNLHNQILLEFKNLREERSDTWHKGDRKYTKKEQLYLDLYGYPYALDLWKPHITIAKVPRDRVKQAISTLEASQLDLIFSRIVIGQVGVSGTLRNVVGD